MAPLVRALWPVAVLLLASVFPSQAAVCQSDGKHRSRDCIVGTFRPASPTLPVVANPMPAPVNTILLQEEFETWDAQRSAAMQSFLKEILGFQYFAHARDTFANHLRGTWGILHAWGQPVEICRAGLFHTIYGGDLFIFSTLDPFQAASRDRFREVVGEEAESLTWDFGTLSRSLVNATLFSARHAELPPSMVLDSFLGPGRNVTARQLAKIMVVTIADYLDQLVEINLWRDFHSHEPPPLLYPGQMKPEVALYWISRACKGIREHLDVVPPIFDHCTVEISYEEEKLARDLYWQATVESTHLGPAIQTELLQSAVRHNPFIAEPHIYLAELAFQGGRPAECAQSARQAVNLLYQMGAHWDKRLPYRQWVSHARLLLLRCARLMEGKPSMPQTEHGVVLTNQLVDEMLRVSPVQEEPKFSKFKAAMTKDSCCQANSTVSSPISSEFAIF